MQNTKHPFKDTHTLAFIHFHRLDECALSEFLKIHLSGTPCVMLVQNDKNIIEDNGEVLQEKEFTLLGRKFIFKYCVYYTQTLRDLKLPFFHGYGTTDNLGLLMWGNCDYGLYIIKHFFPQFKFYFLIEGDCFFNGDYKDFFLKFREDDTDLIMPRKWKVPEKDSGWSWIVDTDWAYEPKEWYGSLFCCVRASARVLDMLYPKRLEYGEIFSKIDQKKQPSKWIGNELFVPSEAVKLGFSLEALPNNKIHFRPEIDLNDTRHFTFPDNCMYHPIKGNFLQRLADKDKAFEAERAKFRAEIMSLNNEISGLKNEFKTLPRKISEQELINLKLDENVKKIQVKEMEQNLNIKKLEVKKLEKELGLKLSKLEPRVVLNLNENLRNSAVARVRNHLAYKLGAAIIVCNKSFFGILSLPFVLSFIKAQYKKEQVAYQTLIKQKPEFKLPKIETYKDYQAALKEKECFTYKLGEAMMRADKSWLSGDYVRFYFEAKRLEKEFKASKNES